MKTVLQRIATYPWIVQERSHAMGSRWHIYARTARRKTRWEAEELRRWLEERYWDEAVYRVVKTQAKRRDRE